MDINYYLLIAEKLQKESGYKTDGCTFPGSKKLAKANWYPACRSHDFGARDLIDGVKPGINNDWHFLKANLYLGNWIWGPVAYLMVSPYSIVKHDLGLKIPLVPFFALSGFIGLIAYAVLTA